MAGGIAIENPSASENRKAAIISRTVTVAGFVMIYAVMLSFFTPQLILSPTTTAGGDTGAHIYVADYLINHLLPSGRITGWSQGWYAGFPMLAFYFPLPFLLIAALSTIIKFQIAFKLVTVLGIFLLPVLTYSAFRVLGFKFPLPVIAAGFTLPFLFMESYSIYGANIMSTLAGEFGYSISFALSVLFLALLQRDTSSGRFRVSTGVLLGLIALTHIVTTIIAVLFSFYFFAGRRPLRRFAIVIGVFILGFALSAFWGLPFIDKIEYTAHMQWDQLKGLDELFPYPVRPVLFISLVGLIGAMAKRDQRTYPYMWAIFVSFILFFITPPGKLWNGRLLPYFYFFTFIWAAYGVWFLRKTLAQLFNKLANIPKRNAEYIIALLSITIVLAHTIGSEEQTHNWIKWNYSGFENKECWKSFNEINEYIKKLPEGRVMIEHSERIDKFGTPRAFELLPYFANHPTIEGTLMEASISAPFHFANQAELSEEPSYAILGIDYPDFDVESGIRHLKLYNIRYFLALSNKVKREADISKNLKFLKKFDVAYDDPKGELKFRLYEVKGVDTNGYVSIPKYQPVLVRTNNWRDTALKWYSRPDLFEVPVVDLNHAQDLKGKYQVVKGDLKGEIDLKPTIRSEISNVELTDDGISFSTGAVGMPHWIKVSYFPNWKAQGADGPYLVSPSVMMVIPRQKFVHLYYDDTLSDIVGRYVSIAAWLGVVFYALILLIYRIYVRRRKLLENKDTGTEISEISPDNGERLPEEQTEGGLQDGVFQH